MKCTSCGDDVLPEHFCKSCGSFAHKQEEKEKIKEKCNEIVHDGDYKVTGMDNKVDSFSAIIVSGNLIISGMNNKVFGVQCKNSPQVTGMDNKVKAISW